jgi:rare lipoprotein A
MKAGWLLFPGVVVALVACQPPATPPGAGTPHYVVGHPYQADGVWHYPREQFDYVATGLATVTTRQGGLTADGEVADPKAMAAAHPTLQLPTIARVTNLDNGYQVLVRINDRGPANPGRLIALTPRAMALLRASDPTATRVRIEVLPAESLQLATELGGAEAPHLEMTMAPVGEVTAESLPPPPGVNVERRTRLAAAGPPPAVHSAAPASLPPLSAREPEVVTRVAPRPGSLYVEAASFGHVEDALLLQRRLAALGAEVSADYAAPHEQAYRVRIGPLSVAQADTVLARVIRAGVTDARIVAE